MLTKQSENQIFSRFCWIRKSTDFFFRFSPFFFLVNDVLLQLRRVQFYQNKAKHRCYNAFLLFDFEMHSKMAFLDLIFSSLFEYRQTQNEYLDVIKIFKFVREQATFLHFPLANFINICCEESYLRQLLECRAVFYWN